MGRKLLYLIFFISFIAQSQKIEPGDLFSQMIGKNIKQYTKNSKRAYMLGDVDRAQFLFDSLVNNVINGSYLDNFKVRRLSGRNIELYEFEKPIFLITYASWCTPGIGEIPALNIIAEKYHSDIDFVVLFWDSRKNVKRASKEYSRKINILYVDETENKHDHIVEVMKHSLGFPTSFFIDANKKIIDVRRGAIYPYNEPYSDSYKMNYTSFLNGISLLKNLGTEDSDLVAHKKP